MVMRRALLSGRSAPERFIPRGRGLLCALRRGLQRRRGRGLAIVFSAGIPWRWARARLVACEHFLGFLPARRAHKCRRSRNSLGSLWRLDVSKVLHLVLVFLHLLFSYLVFHFIIEITSSSSIASWVVNGPSFSRSV